MILTTDKGQRVHSICGCHRLGAGAHPAKVVYALHQEYMMSGAEEATKFGGGQICYQDGENYNPME